MDRTHSRNDRPVSRSITAAATAGPNPPATTSTNDTAAPVTEAKDHSDHDIT